MYKSFLSGIFLTIVLALLAKLASLIPVVSMFGSMIIAILFGIMARPCLERKLPDYQDGITFTAKTVLRLGIIFMGLRLNITDIYHAGWRILLLDCSVILFTISIVMLLGKKYKVNKPLATLVSVGTGICGAAAIGAIAPVIKAKEEDIALSVGIISILGTLFTLLDSSINAMAGNIPAEIFGIFTGSTLHELGHVVAAAASAGQQASDYAILVKLGRVACIAPVAVIINYVYNKKEKDPAAIAKSFPLFILGFLAMSLVKSFAGLPPTLINSLTDLSAFLLTMAMAAFGLNVKLSAIKKTGARPFMIAFAGSILLNIFVLFMLHVLNYI